MYISKQSKNQIKKIFNKMSYKYSIISFRNYTYLNLKRTPHSIGNREKEGRGSELLQSNKGICRNPQLT